MMHDIDRTQAEAYGETYEAGPTQFGYETAPQYAGEWTGMLPGELPTEYGAAGEAPGELEGGFAGTAETYGGPSHELTNVGEAYGESNPEFTAMGETYSGLETGYMPEAEFGNPEYEALEMELAAELLEVTNEAELDRFLGGLFRRVGGFFRRVIRSPIMRGLGGILKNVAQRVLPMVGGALGSMVAPGIGTAIGSSLGSAAGRLFGAELEGLSPEDREFEIARRYVRLAASAMQRAALAPANVPPDIVAQRSFYAAARRYAPGLVVVTPLRTRPRLPATNGTAMPSAIPAGMPQTNYNSAGMQATTPALPAPSGASAAPLPMATPGTLGAPQPYARRQGRWIRRGNRIILFGL